MLLKQAGAKRLQGPQEPSLTLEQWRTQGELGVESLHLSELKI